MERQSIITAGKLEPSRQWEGTEKGYRHRAGISGFDLLKIVSEN